METTVIDKYILLYNSIYKNSTRFYVVMWHRILYFLQNLLISLLSAVRALNFLARRIQPFLSLVDCEVEFCVLTI